LSARAQIHKQQVNSFWFCQQRFQVSSPVSRNRFRFHYWIAENCQNRRNL